ncbi:hypothetical protein [Nostoc sp. TCL26-01]|uniref:hypothetical protein n=1 Tax=Nostoc sp. TCL26-01 TaxID=2576904 RepID=UPI0015BDA2DE|nr:hypothetical protein [Nostoc sp. TCL26-01]QLE55465.1 hypothetical protein FD725_08015 [Nostoc sp. TCL26-01]
MNDRIDVKTAVKAAYEYIISIQDMLGNSLNDLRLEEVELSPDQQFWLITLGFDVSEKSQPSPLFNSSVTTKRVYKLFKVDSFTGKVEAMKIREV